jgi:hypothetical protein
VSQKLNIWLLLEAEVELIIMEAAEVLVDSELEQVFQLHQDQPIKLL